MDKRYLAIHSRLSSLSLQELQLLKDNIDKVCNDTFNYDEENDTFCPLATALNLPNILEKPTNELVIEILAKRFSPVNVVKGIEGDFYTVNREKDLLWMVNKLIQERVH